eukprot:g21783.t1
MLKNIVFNVALQQAAVAVDSLTPEEAGNFLSAFNFTPDEPPVRLYGGYASSNFKAVGRKAGEGERQTLLLKPGDKVLADDEAKAPKLISELSAALAKLHQVKWPDRKLRRNLTETKSETGALKLRH